MAKGRSPNYPRLTLAEAVERLRPVYEGIHTYPTAKEVVAESMGYSSLSGRPLTLIGTMRRYGLLKTEGGKLKITDTAVAILELPPGSAERQQAFAEAAFTPILFSELRAEFPGQLPNDSTLRHNLIKKGFLPKAADEIIRVFRANLELVEEESRGYNRPMSTTETYPPAIPPTQRDFALAQMRALASKAEADSVGLRISVPSEGKEMRFNISRGSEAQVIFRGPVTQEAIERFKSLLELLKDTFPTEAELQPVEKQEGGE